MKKFSLAVLLPLVMLLLQGCGSGEKNGSLLLVYSITAILSVALLCGCLFFLRKRDKWFVMLFSCIALVNCAYLALACATSCKFALLANSVAYLGSVFLPFAMLMIICRVCSVEVKKWLKITLLCVAIAVSLVTASPLFSTLYYRSVSLEQLGGASILCKVYGPLHAIYPVYLFGYFAAMIALIAYAWHKKRLNSFFHVFMLWGAVFVNIGVWLLEQSVRIPFEFLSVSYIITELFLLTLQLMLQQFEQLRKKPAESKEFVPCEDAEQCQFFAENLPTLTPTERTIYQLYLQGKGTKDILQELNIKENTLKYHNKNIYSKLGVSSRKQLVQIAKTLNCEESK